MSPVSFLRMIYSEVTGPSRREHTLTQHRSPGVDPGPPSAGVDPGLPSAGLASPPSSFLGRGSRHRGMRARCVHRRTCCGEKPESPPRGQLAGLPGLASGARRVPS